MLRPKRARKQCFSLWCASGENLFFFFYVFHFDVHQERICFFFFYVFHFGVQSILFLCGISRKIHLFQAKLTCSKFLFKRMKCHVTNLQPIWATYLLPAFQNYYIQA